MACICPAVHQYTDHITSTRWFKPVLGITILGAILLTGYATGITESLDVATIQAWMQQWGMLGLALFLVAFIAGNLLSIPGMLFITAAVLAYGPWTGGAVAWTGALIACLSSYTIAKQFRPDARNADEQASKPRPKWVEAMLSKLEDCPVAIIFVLRLLMIASPPLNYALAFSKITTRQYVLGTALGLLPPVIAVSALGGSFFGA